MIAILLVAFAAARSPPLLPLPVCDAQTACESSPATSSFSLLRPLVTIADLELLEDALVDPSTRLGEVDDAAGRRTLAAGACAATGLANEASAAALTCSTRHSLGTLKLCQRSDGRWRMVRVRASEGERGEGAGGGGGSEGEGS